MRKYLFRVALIVGLIGSLVVSSLPVMASPASALRASAAPASVVSARSDGVVGDAESSELDMSSDGRYVAFSSEAANLAPGAPGSISQIYRKDLMTGQIVLVSAGAAGAAGDMDSAWPRISADGTRVVFVSRSSNLDGGGGLYQIFARDLAQPGGARLITRAPTLEAGDSDSWAPTISADGSTIAFSSSSQNLVKDSSISDAQVFVARWDSSSTISFVSLQSRSSTPGLANRSAGSPSISADGSIVTFTSSASNLTGDVVPPFRTQIWMRNLVAGTTVLVSKGATGGAEPVDSDWSSVSADGTKVAYASGGQIRLRNVTDGRTTLVSASRLASRGADGTSYSPTISEDGNTVAFSSTATDLTAASNPAWSFSLTQAYRRDIRAGTTIMMSTVAGDPTLGAGQGATYASLSGDGTTVGFITDSGDITDPPSTGTQVYSRVIAGPSVDRIAGADRYSVAAGVGADTFGPGRDVVYLATGAGFPDALAAAAAAGSGVGPVLLVTRDTIPTDTGAELARLKPQKIVLAGGESTISADVERALKKYSGSVERIGGVDRYAVAAAMSASAFPKGPVPTVYLASGQVFPDALAGAAATGGRSPVLLITKDSVPEAARLELARLAPSKIVVLGGPNTVSDTVLASLPKSATVTRIGGADRYTVSATVSSETFAPEIGTVYVASGAVFPDALSGSAAAIADQAPVLLVTKEAIPPSVDAELTRLKPHRIVVLGGVNTISDAVQSALQGYLTK